MHKNDNFASMWQLQKNIKNMWLFYPCPKMGKDAINSIINPLHPTKSNNDMDIPKADGPWKSVYITPFLKLQISWYNLC